MTRLKILAACALALAIFVPVVPTSAVADTVVSQLRVEADYQALDPGTSYASATARVFSSQSPGCSGTDRQKVKRATALGVLEYAGDVNDRVDPLRAQSFASQPGLFVCQIGPFSNDQSDFDPVWLYRVNHEEPTIGADQFELARGDEVLWYFADFASGVNTGRELALDAPARARPDEKVRVKVVSYNGDGDRKRPAGVEIVDVEGSETVATTNGDGEAKVRVDEGVTRLRAIKGDDIPSAPVDVCASNDSGDCPKRRGETFVGSDRDDEIDGTKGADDVRARGGDDSVDVEGGERDEVDCGGGKDDVVADREDRVAGDCEDVKD